MLAEVTHRNEIHTVDYTNDGEPIVEFIDDRRDGHALIYHYALSGAHTGLTIDMLMINPHIEHDEDGWHAAWDKLLWADDKTPFDDAALLDSYLDALRDDLREIIEQTWD